MHITAKKHLISVSKILDRCNKQNGGMHYDRQAVANAKDALLSDDPTAIMKCLCDCTERLSDIYELKHVDLLLLKAAEPAINAAINFLGDNRDSKHQRYDAPIQ